MTRGETGLPLPPVEAPLPLVDNPVVFEVEVDEVVEVGKVDFSSILLLGGVFLDMPKELSFCVNGE